MNLVSMLARRLALASVVLSLLLLSSATASAHEHREVGEYILTVGFAEESALQGEPNAVSLRVERGPEDAAMPVEGLQGLKVEVRHGSESTNLDLRAAFGDPGHYVADLIPGATGTCTFHFTGEIEGTAIDEEFTSGPETFSDVEPTADITFPAIAGAADDSGSEAQDTADCARTLAVVGVVVGLLGLAAGAAGLWMAMNARSQRGTGPRPVSGDTAD